MPLIRRGAGQLSMVLPIGVTFAGNAAPAANTAYFVLFRVVAPLLITYVSYYCSSASGNVKGGLFTWDGSVFTPVSVSASTPASGAGVDQDLPIAVPSYAQPGLTYGLGWSADNGTIIVGRTSAPATVAAYGGFQLAKASAFSVFDQSVSALSGSSFQPWMAAK